MNLNLKAIIPGIILILGVGVLFVPSAFARMVRGVETAEGLSWSPRQIIEAYEWVEGQNDGFFEIGKRWYEIFLPNIFTIREAILHRRTLREVALEYKTERIGFLIQLRNLRTLGEDAIGQLVERCGIKMQTYAMNTVDLVTDNMRGNDLFLNLTKEVWNAKDLKDAVGKVKVLFNIFYHSDPAYFDYLNKEVLWKSLTKRERKIFGVLASGDLEVAKKYMVNYLKAIEDKLRGN